MARRGGRAPPRRPRQPPPPRPPPPPPASQEAGLRALGLLDFVRLRPDDAPPRRDLVAALVANYKQFYEWSYARGAFVKVSLDAFADALRLPPPTEGPPDAAAAAPPGLASAAEWFIEAYILKPLRARAAAEGRPRRLPSDVDLALYRAKFGMVHKVDWSRLIWDLAEKEMVDLSKGRRPDWTCHYAAYLQRLIWVDNPGLFQPALPLLGLGGDQNLPSELQSKMQEVEARSKLLDARSKLLDTRAEHLESKSKELEERALASKTLTELELLNRNLLAEKEAINSELVGVQEELGEARKQLMQLDDSMESMKSLSKALFSRERKSNARLLNARWALVTKEIKGNGDLKSHQEELAELQDGMQGLKSLNQVLCSRERESNVQLLDTRWALVTKEIKGNGDLKNLREELAELRDGMQGLESLNQVLVTKNLIDNDKLQAARKELIDGLMVATNGRANIGLKRMGELDPKAVANACRPRLSQKKTLILCSKWEAEIRNAGWHPFKVIMVDDQPMEIFLDDDDKLVELKQEYGDQMFALVKQALIERNKYNPSGGYPETLLWNFKHSREATMEEAVQFIVKKCCANKRKR
ncbi:hypothetical protein VPH35_023869 [Triticum aestivum]|uniref:factor of DNA methylation 2 isoform X1 n=1 Tax=Triticum aestivum TaxID=4565 RepID=UPI0008440817|nr:factor of DNA methylation 2-like isoform X1 [Triticum aestivum]